jgi:hypothetical protein
MKNSNTLILFTLTLFLFSACGEGEKDSNTKTMKNPVDTYLDSRVDAMDLANKSLEESNKRHTEQEEQMKALNKQ